MVLVVIVPSSSIVKPFEFTMTRFDRESVTPDGSGREKRIRSALGAAA
jgi:hypothetical protein